MCGNNFIPICCLQPGLRCEKCLVPEHSRFPLIGRGESDLVRCAVFLWGLEVFHISETSRQQPHHNKREEVNLMKDRTN